MIGIIGDTPLSKLVSASVGCFGQTYQIHIKTEDATEQQGEGFVDSNVMLSHTPHCPCLLAKCSIIVLAHCAKDEDRLLKTLAAPKAHCKCDDSRASATIPAYSLLVYCWTPSHTITSIALADAFPEAVIAEAIAPDDEFISGYAGSSRTQGRVHISPVHVRAGPHHQRTLHALASALKWDLVNAAALREVRGGRLIVETLHVACVATGSSLAQLLASDEGRLCAGALVAEAALAWTQANSDAPVATYKGYPLFLLQAALALPLWLCAPALRHLGVLTDASLGAITGTSRLTSVSFSPLLAALRAPPNSLLAAACAHVALMKSALMSPPSKAPERKAAAAQQLSWDANTTHISHLEASPLPLNARELLWLLGEERVAAATGWLSQALAVAISALLALMLLAMTLLFR